jgi:hypothetical protein
MSKLVYSTYLGQNSTAGGVAIALDGSLNAYVAGNAGPSFPTTANAFQKNAILGGAFLAELDATGSSLVYATYVTGTGGAVDPEGYTGSMGSQAEAVAVDKSRNVFLTGLSYSLDFPFLNPVQPCTGNVTTFVSEFASSGTLEFSTCLGATAANAVPTLANNIVVDFLEKVYVTGISDASLPLKNPIESTPATIGPPSAGTFGLFISEIDPVTYGLVFSSFVGGPTVPCCDSTGDHVTAIAVDTNKNIYAVGFSASLYVGTTDLFPIFNALQPLFGPPAVCTYRYGCVEDAIIMKISPGPGAAAAVSPSQLIFGATQIGTKSTLQTLTVYDMGTDPLTVSNVAVTGDFEQSNDCTPSVPAAASCAIQVTFAPTTPAAFDNHGYFAG